ncbi:MAG TPA: NAD(P)/FAD-dependent oxidoreductase [Candidatus Sulfotelmatobacter sp.]
MIQSFNALILGGGAAGLMCAIAAGKRGRTVAALEHADRPGKKILISGGGRCNFTNRHCQPEDFLSANPHFAKSALARYTPADFIAMVEQYHIPYHEKTLGQLFCDRSAQDILGMLEEECSAAGAKIFLGAKIQEVTRSTEFIVRTATTEFRAPVLVVATGGLSIPKMGATSFGYDLAKQFGLRIRKPWPGLVPLLLQPEDKSRYCDLAGVSTEIVASCAGQPSGEKKFREKMLITHRGLSGPAILQISSYWQTPRPIVIDLAPGRSLTVALCDPSSRDSKTPRNAAALRAQFRKILPVRLADRWLDLHVPPELANRKNAWSNSALAELERQAHAWAITPGGTEGFEKAEVTAGGVDTDELSAKTMESRKVPGLFFIGEVVDVTGHLGGFNFQWAWSSGAAAGGAL